MKRLILNNGRHNKSMDVRAKQRLYYQRRPLNFSGLGGGFAPRHLSRWAFRGKFEADSVWTKI